MYHLEGKINEIIMTFRCCFSAATDNGRVEKWMNCKLTSKLFLAPQMNCLVKNDFCALIVKLNEAWWFWKWLCQEDSRIWSWKVRNNKKKKYSDEKCDEKKTRIIDDYLQRSEICLILKVPWIKKPQQRIRQRAKGVDQRHHQHGQQPWFAFHRSRS